MRSVRLPTPRSEISELKQRVYDLERRMRGLTGSTRPDGVETEVIFHMEGALTVATSDPYVPTRRGNLLVVSCVLDVAGSSSSVVSIKKNGTELTTVTLASSDTFEMKNINNKFSLRVDELTIGVTTAGTAAEGLVVTAVFI